LHSFQCAKNKAAKKCLRLITSTSAAPAAPRAVGWASGCAQRATFDATPISPEASKRAGRQRALNRCGYFFLSSSGWTCCLLHDGLLSLGRRERHRAVRMLMGKPLPHLCHVEHRVPCLTDRQRICCSPCLAGELAVARDVSSGSCRHECACEVNGVVHVLSSRAEGSELHA
jgi:hypothetical protein